MRVFMRFPEFKRKAVTLSYDDATVWDKELIQVMDKYGLKGTFNVNSELFAPEGEKQRRMTKSEARALYENCPHEVAIHGAKHLFPTRLETGALLREFMVDRENLEGMFGTLIKGSAYAFGDYNDEVVDALKKCGIVYARTTKQNDSFAIPQDWLRWETTCYHRNPSLMDTAKKFIENDVPNDSIQAKPLLFTLWGHSYEFQDHNEWDIIESFGKYVGGRADIFYGTNMEIYNAVEDFRNLQYSADGSMVFNPSCRDVYMSNKGENILIPAGASIRIQRG